MPEPFQVEARSLAAAAQTSDVETVDFLVALAPAGGRQDFAALRGRVARRRDRIGCPSCLWRQLRGSAAAVLAGLPQGNAEGPSEAPGASKRCPLGEVHRK